MSDNRTVAVGGQQNGKLSQPGELEETRALLYILSVIKCPYVIETDLKKHWRCLLICADGTHGAGHRPNCLATEAYPMGLASHLAPIWSLSWSLLALFSLLYKWLLLG